MKLGIGKLPDDALLFANLDGGLLRPGNCPPVGPRMPQRWACRA